MPLRRARALPSPHTRWVPFFIPHRRQLGGPGSLSLWEWFWGAAATQAGGSEHRLTAARFPGAEEWEQPRCAPAGKRTVVQPVCAGTHAAVCRVQGGAGCNLGLYLQDRTPSGRANTRGHPGMTVNLWGQQQLGWGVSGVVLMGREFFGCRMRQ